MSYNNNRGSYSNNSGYSSYSSYSNDSGNSGSYIPSSRRPDGSYREEIRVRPGFVPEAERQSYAPPAARNYSSSGNLNSGSQESLEDRVDSWADEDAPVIHETVRAPEPEIEAATVTETKEAVKEVEVEKVTGTVEAVEKAETVETVKNVVDDTEEVAEAAAPAREPRKPSQLATAIDTALDSLSIGSPNSTEATNTRQIGRFAAQIASDEREGRSYRRYDGYSNTSGYNREGGYNRDGQGSYNRDGQSGYNRDNNYSRPYNNWNRTNYYNASKDVIEESNGTASNSSETRVESEFKTFLEQLNVYRREMAVINAKLEYIKYVKSRDARELTEVEKERLTIESSLVARLDAIFESIDALASK
jgi:hypothetical protein